MTTPIRGDRRPAVRLLTALIVLLALLGPAVPGPAAVAQGTGDEAALDLPAMAPTPEDLAAAGTKGYLLLPGEAVGLDELPYQIGEWTEQVTNDDIRATLEEAGLRRGHTFGLRLRQDPDDPRSDLARDVYGSVHEFADEDGAETALALFDELTAESELGERVEGDEPVGDGAILLRGQSRQEDNPAQQLFMAFRADRIVALLQIWDYPGEEPAVAEAEAIGARLLERIEAVLAGGAPGLGTRVLRVVDDEFQALYEVRLDQYLRLDGEDGRFTFEEESAFAARVETAGDAIDAYALNQFVQDAETDPPVPGQFVWGVRLYRFAGEEEASAWLAAQSARLPGLDGRDVEIDELEPLADAPAFGDESMALTYLEDDGDGSLSRVVRIQARVDATVADIRLSTFASEEPPVAAVEGLAAAQVACLANGGCPDPVRLSDAVTGQAAPAGDEPDGGVLLDLPAMTLTPEDLDDERLEGYGLGFGETTFSDQVIASTAEARDLAEDEVAEILDDAGFVRRYDSYLYLPADEDDPTGPAARLVVSYVLEFADADGAEAAFDFFEDESASESAEDVEGAEELGDQSELTRDQGEDPATGDEYAQLDLTLRLGNLIAGVALVDWEGDEPEPADAEALAARLLERIETVLDEGAPGLGSQALRLAGDAIVPAADYYILLDGQALVQSGDAPGDARAREDAAAELDQTDAYRVWQQLHVGSDDPADDVWYLADLVRFADEEAAADWIGDTEDRIAANQGLTDLEIEESGAGDEALFYTVETVDGDTRYRSVIIRVGPTVATIDLSGPETPPDTAIAALAAAQVACLEDEGCLEPQPVPSHLEDYIEGLDQADRDDDADRDEDDRDETPDAEETTEAEETPDDEQTAAGETYVSPDWGYTVTWDPDAWVGEPRSGEDGIELNIMGNLLVMAVIEGVEGYDGDPAACLEGMVEAAEGDTPLTPAEDRPAPATVEGAVGGVYDLGDFAVMYFECRELVPDEAVLQVRFAAPEGDYEAALPALEELLAGIEVA